MKCKQVGEGNKRGLVMPLVPWCTEESWYPWDNSLSVPTCSTHFNTYALPYCSSLFPLMMPCVSLWFQFIWFFSWVWMLFKQRGMGNGAVRKIDYSMHVMGLTEFWWPQSFGKWKKQNFSVLIGGPQMAEGQTISVTSRGVSWQHKLCEAATAGWALRVSCYHPL